jgi:hypothetical protein
MLSKQRLSQLSCGEPLAGMAKQGIGSENGEGCRDAISFFGLERHHLQMKGEPEFRDLWFCIGPVSKEDTGQDARFHCSVLVTISRSGTS